MHRALLLWSLSLLITLGVAVYQRMTGPTYPLRGEVKGADAVAQKYKLPRSHGGEGGAEVSLPLAASNSKPELLYRRYKTDDSWTRLSMKTEQDQWIATLPHQPPAGKIEYYVELGSGASLRRLPENRAVVIRYKGGVPPWALIPHILFMFAAMLLTTRSALEAISKGPRLRIYAWLSTTTLLLGGMIFGPIVQKYAFGAFWTGVPFGFDLTDNKTLIAALAWVAALIFVGAGQSRRARSMVLSAALVLYAVFSIPHSVLGSELDHKTGKVVTGD